MEIYLSLLFAVIGAFMYAFAANPKLAEMGRILFGVGMLAFLLGAASGRLLSVLPR